jgi:hypothetical protein
MKVIQCFDKEISKEDLAVSATAIEMTVPLFTQSQRIREIADYIIFHTRWNITAGTGDFKTTIRLLHDSAIALTPDNFIEVEGIGLNDGTAITFPKVWQVNVGSGQKHCLIGHTAVDSIMYASVQSNFHPWLYFKSEYGALTAGYARCKLLFCTRS